MNKEIDKKTEQATNKTAKDEADKATIKETDKKPVELNGDKVEFVLEENKFTAQGNVIIEQEGAKLFADRLDLYRGENVAVAEGNIRFDTSEGVITADKMTYNFEKQTGKFANAGFYAAPFYGKGQNLAKLGPNHIHMYQGYLTTCDHDKPHFQLFSKDINVFPGDKAVARNVKLKLGTVPVLYLPKYTQDLSDRRPRYTIMPGYTKDFGFMLLQTYRYPVNDNVTATFHLDYREKRDIASGFDVNYNSASYGNGIFKAYYMNERLISSKRIWQERLTPTTEHERFRTEWRHKWEIDKTTQAIWQYYRASDPSIVKEYFEREYRADPSANTYFLLSKVLPKGTLSFRLDKRVNRFTSQVERLPEIKYDLSNQELGTTNLYLKSVNTYSNLTLKDPSPTEVRKSTHRVDSDNEISYPMKIAFVEVKPLVGGQATYYSRMKDKADYDSVRGQFKTGADLSTKFFKVMDAHYESRFLKIDKLRHIVTPSLAYRYKHDPTIPSSKLDIFDSVDSIDRSHIIGMSLENKFQTKRGEEAVDLVRTIVNSPFYLKEDRTPGGFGPVTSDIEFKPNDWMTFYADTSYDHKNEYLTSANFDLYLKGGDKWAFDFGKRYARGADDQIAAGVEYRINPKWKLRLYERVDINKGIQKVSEYTVTRDLHEWEMDINFNQTRGSGSEIWLVFRLKAFPDSAIDFGTSFNRRKAGSQSSEGF